MLLLLLLSTFALADTSLSDNSWQMIVKREYIDPDWWVNHTMNLPRDVVLIQRPLSNIFKRAPWKGKQDRGYDLIFRFRSYMDIFGGEGVSINMWFPTHKAAQAVADRVNEAWGIHDQCEEMLKACDFEALFKTPIKTELSAFELPYAIFDQPFERFETFIKMGIHKICESDLKRLGMVRGLYPIFDVKFGDPAMYWMHGDPIGYPAHEFETVSKEDLIKDLVDYSPGYGLR